MLSMRTKRTERKGKSLQGVVSLYLSHIRSSLCRQLPIMLDVTEHVRPFTHYFACCFAKFETGQTLILATCKRKRAQQLPAMQQFAQGFIGDP